MENNSKLLYSSQILTLQMCGCQNRGDQFLQEGLQQPEISIEYNETKLLKRQVFL